MKKLKFILAIAFVLLISSCRQNEIPKNSSTQAETPNTSEVTTATTTNIPEPTQAAEKPYILPVQKSEEDMTQLTKISQFSHDIDGDEEEETIILYTAAGFNEEGEIIWDDGQMWRLVVEDGEQVYVLFDKYVQLGSAYFEFSEYYIKDSRIPTVTLIVSEGAGFYLTNYSFDKANKYFTEEEVFTTSDKTDAGTSKWFSSIPSIQKPFSE